MRTTYIAEIKKSEFELFRALAGRNAAFPQTFDDWGRSHVAASAAAVNNGFLVEIVRVRLEDFRVFTGRFVIHKPFLQILDDCAKSTALSLKSMGTPANENDKIEPPE